MHAHPFFKIILTSGKGRKQKLVNSTIFPAFYFFLNYIRNERYKNVKFLKIWVSVGYLLCYAICEYLQYFIFKKLET